MTLFPAQFFPIAVISALSSKEALRLRKRAQSRPSLVGILVGDDNEINTRNKDNQTHLVYPSLPSDPSRTKEARQIEALAIMDGIGGDTTRPVLALLGDDREAPAGGADIASRQALLLQKHIESRKGGNRVSYPSGVITTTIKQVFSDGQVKDLTVNAAQRAFLELMSDGLESQDIDVLDVPKEKAWWEVDLNEVDLNTEQADHVLDEFSSHHHDPLQHYTHLGAMSQRGDKSMTAVSPQCRIAVLDVANDIGPSIEARQYDLSHKRVWPFAQQNYGIDGVATLLPEDYQYSIEYWISGGIRASERYTTDLDAADFIFVDYWTYHLAWLAYVHPLGSRNITNPEPYMRLSLAKILQSER